MAVFTFNKADAEEAGADIAHLGNFLAPRGVLSKEKAQHNLENNAEQDHNIARKSNGAHDFVESIPNLFHFEISI